MLAMMTLTCGSGANYLYDAEFRFERRSQQKNSGCAGCFCSLVFYGPCLCKAVFARCVCVCVCVCVMSIWADLMLCESKLWEGKGMFLLCQATMF